MIIGIGLFTKGKILTRDYCACDLMAMFAYESPPGRPEFQPENGTRGDIKAADVLDRAA